MRKRYVKLLRRLNAEIDLQKSFDLTNLIIYSGPNRAYHNLNHIKECLDEFETSKHLAEKPDELEMAIWYHDIIYDTEKKDNEEESAKFAYDICKSIKLSKIFAQRVHDLILFTKHNKLPDIIDGKLIIDIDLSILGKPSERFNEYEKSIRKEYSWVSEQYFRDGRSSILQGFLDRPSIYLTEFFQKKYESSARKNLANSIKNLKRIN
mgnify:CR=1 FL=1